MFCIRSLQRIGFLFCLLALTFLVACSGSQPSKEEADQAINYYLMNCSWNLDGKLYRDEKALNADNLSISTQPVKSNGADITLMLIVGPSISLSPTSYNSNRSWVTVRDFKLKRTGGGLTLAGQWEVDEPPATISVSRSALENRG